MSLRQTTLSPLLRSVAALALVVFIGAQTLCFIHCNLGGEHGGAATTPACHGTAAQTGHGEGNSSAPAPMASCSTLKNLSASSVVLTHVTPEFAVFYMLAPFALADDATAIELGALNLRQANHSDRVFTPEVSLGPAFRSLAPPFIG